MGPVHGKLDYATAFRSCRYDRTKTGVTWCYVVVDALASLLEGTNECLSNFH